MHRVPSRETAAGTRSDRARSSVASSGPAGVRAAIGPRSRARQWGAPSAPLRECGWRREARSGAGGWNSAGRDTIRIGRGPDRRASRACRWLRAVDGASKTGVRTGSSGSTTQSWTSVPSRRSGLSEVELRLRVAPGPGCGSASSWGELGDPDRGRVEAKPAAAGGSQRRSRADCPPRRASDRLKAFWRERVAVLKEVLEAWAPAYSRASATIAREQQREVGQREEVEAQRRAAVGAAVAAGRAPR